MPASILENANHISNLLVRSPSCSCVLEDAMESVIQAWRGLLGMILISGRTRQLHPFAWVSTGAKIPKPNGTISPGLFSNTLQGSPDILPAGLFKENISLDDIDTFSIVAVPFWLENKIAGIFGLLVDRESPLLGDKSRENLQALQVIVNQVGLLLEKELANETITALKLCFNTVQDSLNEGIVIVGKDKVTYCNHKAKDLLTLDETAVTVQELFAKIERLSKDPLKTRIYLETSRALKDHAYSFILWTRDDRYYAVTNFFIRGSNHKSLSTGYLFSDITKYKEILKTKSNLIAVVSHELRTPLTSIKGNVSSLLRDDVTWSEEQRRDFLADIYEECQRLDTFIQQLLDVSAINAGVLKLEKELTTVDKFIGKLKKMVRSRFSHDLRIVYRVENGADVLGIDEQKIFQVFLNLIHNSVKYAGNDVEITVETKRQDKGVALFAVRDNGPGIPEDQWERIFHKFHRDQGTLKKEGSGLGLAICKGFIEAHGGTIWTKSILNEGASFFFTLPTERPSSGGLRP